METYWVIAELGVNGWVYLKTNINGDRWSKNPYDGRFYKKRDQIIKSVDKLNKNRKSNATIVEIQFKCLGTMSDIADKELLSE